VEWVETTGKTVEEAKDAALDQLGVDEQDAEFEVIDEPKTGLFGRVRSEARVRARVQPTQPRPKVERRTPRRRADAKKPKAAAAGTNGRDQDAVAGAEEATTDAGSDVEAGAARPPAKRRRRSGTGTGAGGGSRTSGAATRAAGGDEEQGDDRADRRAASTEGTNMDDDATVEQQAEITTGFLTGLLDAFDLDASINEERVDEDTIELHVEGTDLGLLVGPKGNTLQAIQELSRTVIQRQVAGTHHGRVRIDIAGYRQKRKLALEKFAAQVAADVAASGEAKSLEPMHPADRKIVHDAINDIEGVRTTSEGEEPRRRVVILPDAD
jgi:spoIIIJ-associated protein